MTDKSTGPLHRALEELKTLKDEAAVQANLAGKELQDFVDRHDDTIMDLQRRVEGLTEEAKSHAPEVKARFVSLVDEVKATLLDARKRLER
jgi:type I site-specific restriction endonuclease